MSRRPASSLARLTPLLAPLSHLFGIITRSRAAAYRRGVFKIHTIEGAAIISVGNLTTGGTGKTPLVRLVARLAAEEMANFDSTLHQPSICILSRGYGRLDSRTRVVVSDGRQLLADARTGGDEPRELAEQLPGMAAVVSDRDRVAAARFAQTHLGSRVFILDDGFQHLRLARDLDIVAIDATDPFGGNHLLPRGRLREHPRTLRRADVIVITRTEQVAPSPQLIHELAHLSDGKPVLLARTKIRAIRPLGEPEARVSSSSLAAPALAFCALGNPEAFFSLLRREGWNLTRTHAFADHYAYRQQDADALATMARACGAEVLLTTAKDAVKLRGLQWDIIPEVVEIDTVIDDEATLRRLVRAAIEDNASSM